MCDDCNDEVTDLLDSMAERHTGRDLRRALDGVRDRMREWEEDAVEDGDLPPADEDDAGGDDEEKEGVDDE